MPLGSPSINTPNKLDLRALQTAISNTRQRIEALEAEVQTATNIANSGGTTSTNLNTLRQQVQALTTRVTALEALFAQLTSPGFVAWSGTALTARTLVAGNDITITNPTGLGDPVIASTAKGGDRVLYDNLGQAMLTNDGQALLVE
jgi:hypothetical protein